MNESILENVAEKIRHSESERIKLVNALAPWRTQNLERIKSRELLENQLVFKIPEHALNEKVAGVDSGFLTKTLHTLDLVMVRTAGVVFQYQNNKLAACQYEPGYYPFPKVFILNDPLQREELDCSQSLYRLQEEIQMAQKLVQEHKPEMVLLDGSIVPQHADKPRKNSGAHKFYQKTIQSFEELYKTAQENNCEVIACVENSRGNRFNSILNEYILQGKPEYEKLLQYVDSVVLDRFLKKGERTLAFPYTRKIKEHPILMDFQESNAQSVCAMYIKPSEFDNVLRVEFLHRDGNVTEHANEIASNIMALSSFHREYAFPSPLIESDLRARLKVEEQEMILDKIFDKIGNHAKLQFRRERRPF